MLASVTQWRYAGMAGVAMGLDYAGVAAAAAALDIPWDADLLGRVRTLEAEYIRAWSEA